MVFNSRMSRLWPIIVVLPALLLYVLFLLLPAAGNIFFSFTDFTGNIHRPLHWIGLRNYERAFRSDLDNLGTVVKITIIFALAVTVLQNMIAIVLAILVNMKLALRNIYRSIIFMPNILGVIVIGIVWVLVFDPYNGPVHMVLEKLGTLNIGGKSFAELKKN